MFEARSAAGLTLRALAEMAGISHTVVNGIEKGHQIPAADTIDALAQALSVSPCWLAYGLGPRQETDG